MPSVRTATHTYPQVEIDAMTSFYGGQKCVISLTLGGVEWSHILDASQPCNEHLSQMLMCNLRQDRHPRHAAEVRENIVPLTPDHHRAVDERPPRATLFLHEDILARALAYEQDIHQWRIAELEAGRGDPGRPTYEEAFGGTQSTLHRFHTAEKFSPFIREVGNGLHIYYHQNCPGIDNPTSQTSFPIIDTLLSIPFSLLHNLPRLAGIVPISVHQQQLITMGSQIVSLWWWDPPPDLIEKSEKICLQKNATNHGTTFLTKQPIITYDTPTTHSSNRNRNQDAPTFDLPSGQVLLGTTPSFFRDGDVLTPQYLYGLAERGDVQRTDKGIVVGAMSLPVTLEAWDVQTIEGTEFSDDINAMEDIEENPPTGPSSSDILLWYEQVAESVPEHPPLIPGSFERGVIGGMSTNDLLMIKGLIDTPVYIQFLDLSLFSHL